MKDAYYFSHDSNARHDPKVIAMRAKYGAEGYGWYWMVVESMRERKDYVIPTSDKYWLNSLAIDLSISKSALKGFIDDCVNEFELFVEADGVIYSESLLERMKRVDRNRQQATDAANKRWRKVREKKEEKEEKKPATKPRKSTKDKSFSILTDNKKWAVYLPELMAHKEFGVKPKEWFEKQRATCIDWVKSKNKQNTYKDWRAMFNNWLRKRIEFDESDNNDVIQSALQ